MSRRRPTLPAYVRRRWRVVGAIVVLLLGALLVLAITDRGHGPLWEARAEELDQVALAPDASAAYALVRDGGNITRLVAFRGSDGALLWEGPLFAPRALLAAGPAGAAVATDFPRAFLTAYGADGSIRLQVPLEGNPIAMAIEGDHLALALNAPRNPVLLYQGEHLARVFHHASPVRALDLEGGLLAIGGLQGEVIVHGMDGTTIANATLPISPRSVRLAHDATALVVGGYGLTPSDPQGHVAFLELGADPLVRWQQPTPVGVGIVDLDAAGLLTLAVEESPPSATLHVYDGATGATLWTRDVGGSVARDDAGVTGAASLAPDAARVAVAPQQGALLVLDAHTGEERWTYRVAGAALVAFAEDEPQRVAIAARLTANRPYDTLMMFDASDEPVTQRAGVMAVALVAAAATTLALTIGIGFRRARGPD